MRAGLRPSWSAVVPARSGRTGTVPVVTVKSPLLENCAQDDRAGGACPRMKPISTTKRGGDVQKWSVNEGHRRPQGWCVSPLHHCMHNGAGSTDPQQQELGRSSPTSRLRHRQDQGREGQSCNKAERCWDQAPLSPQPAHSAALLFHSCHLAGRSGSRLQAPWIVSTCTQKPRVDS